MNKLRLFGCLLLSIGLTACGKNDDPVPAVPLGQFVHDGISYDLHNATRFGFYGLSQAMQLVFSSADQKVVIDVTVIANWEGPEKVTPEVELRTGTYGMMRYSVIEDGDRLKAAITLSEDPVNPDWEVECSRKDDGLYDLRLYDPHLPDTQCLTWKGKIVRSNKLL